jgi:hypothetical protein
MARYIYKSKKKSNYPPEYGMGYSVITVFPGTNKAGIPTGRYIVLNGDEIYTWHADGVDISEQQNTPMASFEGDVYAETRTNPIKWTP